MHQLNKHIQRIYYLYICIKFIKKMSNHSDTLSKKHIVDFECLQFQTFYRELY